MSYWPDISHMPVSKPIPGEELLYPPSPTGRLNVIILPQSTRATWRRGGHLHRVRILKGRENRQAKLRGQLTTPTPDVLYKRALPAAK